ncbi:MAG: NAD(P)H-dependent oxidoreductase [Blastocatellia bacterium]|nr:NAD(P)H-dependent oxidoreductase [Blastocatellia bacterium]
MSDEAAIKPFVPILIGTNRAENLSGRAAEWLFAQMQMRADLETELFDVSKYEFSSSDYGPTLRHQFADWSEAMGRADALVIVSPEYNHGYPGTLKCMLDVLRKEYIHKAVGLVGVSSGPWGGTRVIESLVPVVRELGLIVTFTDLHFPKIAAAADGTLAIDEPAHARRATAFLDELIWMAAALRWGRKNLPSKFHPQTESL